MSSERITSAKTSRRFVFALCFEGARDQPRSLGMPDNGSATAFFKCIISYLPEFLVLIRNVNRQFL